MSSPTAPAPTARLDSIDLLRGLIMVVMALDHVRDYFHFSAVQGIDPLDLTRTTPAIFLTRLVTHFCAPIFSFLAGLGVYLALKRGKPKGQLSGFLVTRGLWLIFLELTVLMWFGWDFQVNLHLFFFATLWALGWSMIVLAGLIHVPFRWVALFSALLVFGHNAFDGVKPESWGSWGWIWQFLHVSSVIQTKSGFTLFAFYPLIPWLGVMPAGYCFGRLYELDARERQPRLVRLGLGSLALFVLIRASNLYGNLTPWTKQPDPVFTVLSFLDVTKYPPSLCYLLLTLGVGLVLLAGFERWNPRWLQPALVFGRVPFFYYLLHIPLIHGLAWMTNLIRFGHADFGPVHGTPPPAAGFSLLVTYLVWAAVVVLLYPLCRWFAGLKSRRRDLAWLGYF
ncbi:MAG TPA: heparan-alpha-glucosaminide N-acetyltransferase domain-containing protein [Lacunisphaera sp.]|nr:heparan-alpha-glucosaminide N-acetyltransferase domain-containing protein [Lacunisphaera sp.]